MTHSSSTALQNPPKTLRYFLLLSRFSLLFAFSVVTLGALTRLQDAGLGCPDWPGCYGHLTVPNTPDAEALAGLEYPERPLEKVKAWYEMIHRYLAGTLGLCIAGIFILSRFLPRALKTAIGFTPWGLLGLVLFQAALGMWTVTLGLFPTVVMGHLLGGFLTVSLLLLLNLRLFSLSLSPRKQLALKALQFLPTKIKLLLHIATIAIVMQVALGGWTAANYAAAVCTELPICQSGWQEHLNFTEALRLWGHRTQDHSIQDHGAQDYEFAPHIAADTKITIHIMHRFGAFVVTFAVIALGLQLYKTNRFLLFNKASYFIITLFCTQLILGVSNIVFQVPLAIATLHNLVGCFLFAIFLNLSFASFSLNKQPSFNTPSKHKEKTKGKAREHAHHCLEN